MSRNSKVSKKQLLKLMRKLLETNLHVEVDSWCADNKLSNNDFEEILDLFGSLRLNFELFKKADKTFLVPPSKEALINISLDEWIDLELQTKRRTPSNKLSLYEKLELTQPERERSILDKIAEEIESHEPSLNEREEYIQQIEHAINNNLISTIGFTDTVEVLNPRKIIYLDGDISIIGESIKDGHLQNIHLTQVQSLEVHEQKHKCIYTMYEVDEFINSIRSMNENAIRLVLKIYSREHFSLNFNHIYFDNPCLFANASGDFIWAATLEASDDIFEWLCKLGPAVEILDPSNFKRDFIRYCEHKLKKLA